LKGRREERRKRLPKEPPSPLEGEGPGMRGALSLRDRNARRPLHIPPLTPYLLPDHRSPSPLPSLPTTITDELGIALGNLADAATGTVTPTLRLGVTGLSRAGKTIFITALIHNLLTGARLPGFAPMAEGRLIGVRLAEHPDNATPRFAYENHLAALLGTPPVWPESTRRISQ